MTVAAEDRRRDADTRLRAQRQFDAPQVVEAGAGTGKTAVLVARVLAWCLGTGWERTRARLAADALADAAAPGSVARELLSRIVAITFTEAAAAEMAARVSAGLLEVKQGRLPVGLDAESLPSDADERVARARALLEASDQIAIQTIHAYCRRLLASHPLAAGLHPRFEVDADQAHLEAVARAEVEACLEESYGPDGDEDAFALAVDGLGPRELEGALIALLQAGATPEALGPPLAAERIAPWRDAFAERLDAFVTLEAGRIQAGTRARREAGTAALLASLSARVAGLAPEREALLALADEVREAWDAGAVKRLRDWAREREGLRDEDPHGLGADRAELARHASALVPFVAQLRSADFVRLERGHRVLGRLLARAREALRRRGAVGFADLLREAEALLRNHPEIAARVREGIDQILVDEFQDTDALQCRLLRHLAVGSAGPTLFLVGDPKQSIYGWRNADLAAYDGFVAEVVPEPAERGLLCVNHRSVDAVLREVERCIAPLFGAGSAWQAPFQRLLVSDANADDPGFAEREAAPVEHWVSWAWDEDGAHLPQTTNARATRLEAEAVAADIAGHVAAGASPGAFGLLLRSLGDLDPVLAALRRRGLPYVVERDNNYYRRREILDASCLVRWLLDPNDHLAWVAVLRSSLVGAPDVALRPLWQARVPERAGRLREPGDPALAALQDEVRALAVSEGPPGLERIAGWRENLAGFLADAAELREALDRLPPDRFVERLRRRLLLEASEAARPLGRFRLANLDRFFRDLARALEEDDVSAVVASLRTAVTDAREHEEGRPRDADDRAVHVMTVHKAKGLAFDHVYLLQLHKGTGRDDAHATALVRRGARSALTLLGQPTLEVPLLAHDQTAVAAAEAERLLYVAMTRARRRLVLVGKRDVRGRERSLGAMLERRAEAPALDALADGLAAEPASRRHVDVAGARWVFPGRGRPAEVEPAGPAADSPEDRLARARADAAQLTARAEAARERMARPFHAVASDEHARAGDEAAGGVEDAAAAAGGGAAGGVVGDADAPSAPVRTAAHGRGADPAPRGAPAAASSAEERALAMAAGTAVHAALEVYEPAAGALGQAAARAALEASTTGLPKLRAETAAARAHALFDAFLGSPLHARFEELAPAFVARELPVLLPPENGHGPVGFVSGAIDLVYREPGTGAWVAVDYKTDDVAEADLDERARGYASQGTVYTRALQQALGLAEPPRFELWFLKSGRIVTLPA